MTAEDGSKSWQQTATWSGKLEDDAMHYAIEREEGNFKTRYEWDAEKKQYNHYVNDMAEPYSTGTYDADTKTFTFISRFDNDIVHVYKFKQEGDEITNTIKVTQGEKVLADLKLVSRRKAE